MAKNKKRVNNSKFTTSKVVEQAPNKARRSQHRVKSALDLGKTMVQGTVRNVGNVGDVIKSAFDLDLTGTAKNIAHGAKEYAQSNIAALKNIWGMITGKNHPEWYTKNGDIVTNLNYNTNIASTRKGIKHITVGMAIPFAQELPHIVTRANAMNAYAWRSAISAIYAQLGGSNSSIYPFQREDLEAYIVTGTSIYSQYYALLRAVKTINTIDPTKAQSPIPELRCLGYTKSTLTDVIGNKSRAAVIDQLNYLAKRISALVPMMPDLSYVSRMIWLSGNTFRDDNDEFKAAVINFIPKRFWDYNGKELGYSDVDYEEETISTGLERLESLVNSFTSQARFSEISGYLLKAYGDRAYPSLELVDTGSSIKSVYDEQLLMQFQNATTFAGGTAYTLPESYSWNEVINVVPPRSQITISGVKATSAPIDKENIIVVDTTEVSSGKTLSVSAMANAIRISVPTDNNVYVEASIINTETYIHPTYVYAVDGNYSSALIPQWNPETGISATSAAVHSQVFGAPSLRVLSNDVLNAHNYFKYIGDLKIYAPMSTSQAETFMSTRVASMLKTINIEDQDNWKATTFN